MKSGSLPPNIRITAGNEASAPVFQDRRSFRQLQILLQNLPSVVSVAVLLLSIVVFGIIIGPRFFAPFNLSLVLQQVTVISILGAAQTLVILTSGIDLSVGALMVLCSVVMGVLAVNLGWPPIIAIIVAILAGVAGGAINGILVTVPRLPPFIATLGTWNVFLALELWYSGSQTIVSQDIYEKAPVLQFFGEGTNVGRVRVTWGELLLFALFGLLWFFLNRTAWGRHVYAAGDDPEAARLAGINVKRVLLSVYVVAGAICAIAGWVLIGRIGSVTPQEGQTSNLDSITAVVIGGTSLFGGRGSLFATLIGALIVGVFENGLAIAGVDALWQNFAIGLLIIFAVIVDQQIRKLAA
jgi:fructose transport system permease protein